MKTKNIFRMLLVAAMLLLGANNIKADDYAINGITTIWENPSGKWLNNSTLNDIYIKPWFANVSAGDVLRVYTKDCPNSNTSRQFCIAANNDGSVNKHKEITPLSISRYIWDDFFDIELTQEILNDVASYSTVGVSGQDLQITKLQIVPKANLQYPSSGTKTVYNDSNGRWIGWDGGSGFFISTWILKGAPAGTKVRVTGSHSGSGQVFLRDGSDKNVIELKENVLNRDGENEFVLTSQNLEQLKGYGVFKIVGQNFIVKKVEIIFSEGGNPEPQITYYNVYTNYNFGGTISVDKSSGITAGETISFSLSTYEGYKLDYAPTIQDTGNNAISYTYSNGYYNFTMPASDVTISATFSEIIPTIVEVAVGENKYVTWTPSYAIDYSITPTGVKAYRAKGTTTKNNQLYVELEQITSKVLANTPVILIAENSGTFSFTEAVTGATNIGTNLLSQGTGSVGPNANYYILTVKNGRVVFAQANTQATVPSDKAYLDLSGVSGARARTIRLSFSNNDDGTTAINSIENEQTSNNDIYNMTGQRVANPTKGFYIINSKKVIIK